MSEVYMCYTMECFEPSNYPQGICVISTGFIGVHLYDAESCKKFYSFRDPEDQFYQQIYIREANILAIASQKG